MSPVDTLSAANGDSSATSPLIRPSSLPPHLRRRSSTTTFENSVLPSPTDSVFSNAETVVDMGDDDLYGEEKYKKSGSVDEVSPDQWEAYKSWRDERSLGRRGRARLTWLFIACSLVTAGWAFGRHSSQGLQGNSKDRVDDFSMGDFRPRVCNPYDQHGVLEVNVTVPSENRWVPIAAPQTCQPVDYTSMLLASSTKAPSDRLNFARDRVIALLGDSVDRGHIIHMCDFVGGRIDVIGAQHPMSPAYPPGRELPPEGYKNPYSGEREWGNLDQSRPYICHIESLNTHIIQVFHYGFWEDDKWIRGHGHYYPPGRTEDRFDQILMPLVASVAEKYNTDPVPDIVSLTSGFWGILRLAAQQGGEREKDIADGVDEGLAWTLHDVFGNMGHSKEEWQEKRTMEVVRHIAKGWRSFTAPGEVQTKPQLLWRTLHHVKENTNVPFVRVQTVDQIGRSVVERLIAEGRAAQQGQASWAVWSRKARAALGFKAEAIPETELAALHDGLGERLKVDEWGALMLGQEHHFEDHIHPKPLPGSFLYSNMLFQNLKEAVDRWNTAPHHH